VFVLVMALCVSLAMAQTGAPAHTRAGSAEPCETSLALGINSSSGKTSFLNVSGGAKACTDNGKRRIDFETEIVASNRNGSTALNQWIDAAYEYRFARSWFGTLYMNEQADRDAGLESRIVLAPGAGYQMVPKWGVVALEAGITRTWENTQGAAPVDFPEYWSASQARWKISRVSTLTESLEFYARMSDTADHRWLSDTSLRFRLTERFSLRTSARVQWDNVPAFNYPKTTITTRTQLEYSFNR